MRLFENNFHPLCNAVLASNIVAKMEIYVRKVVLKLKFNIVKRGFAGILDTRKSKKSFNFFFLEKVAFEKKEVQLMTKKFRSLGSE